MFGLRAVASAVAGLLVCAFANGISRIAAVLNASIVNGILVNVIGVRVQGWLSHCKITAYACRSFEVQSHFARGAVTVNRQHSFVNAFRSNAHLMNAQFQSLFTRRCLFARREFGNWKGSRGRMLHTSNEKEINHGRVSWQSLWGCVAMGPLASSTCYMPAVCLAAIAGKKMGDS